MFLQSALLVPTNNQESAIFSLSLFRHHMCVPSTKQVFNAHKNIYVSFRAPEAANLGSEMTSLTCA